VTTPTPSPMRPSSIYLAAANAAKKALPPKSVERLAAWREAYSAEPMDRALVGRAYAACIADPLIAAFFAIQDMYTKVDVAEYREEQARETAA
jgi:hypothetical protein